MPARLWFNGFIVTSTRLLLLLAAAAAQIDPAPYPSAVVLSASRRARFTVLSPRLLRLQWSEEPGSFSDAPTTTIVNRRLPVPAFSVARPAPDALVITTAALRLSFNDSGGGFTAGSLAVTAGAGVAWAPGARQRANLLGTLRFMDCYTTPAACFSDYMGGLSPGLLARDGWTLVNDSAAALRTPAPPDGGLSWWAAPGATAQDLYLIMYGDDFKGALAEAASVMGAPEMPPRAALGVWWSQNYPWGNATGNASIVTGVLDAYAAYDIPLSVLVLFVFCTQR
jgi:hypothetical protein